MLGDFRVEIVQLSDFGRHSELGGGGGRDSIFSPRWDEGDVPRETEICRFPRSSEENEREDVASGVWARVGREADRAAWKWEAEGGREGRTVADRRTDGRTRTDATPFGLTKQKLVL